MTITILSHLGAMKVELNPIKSHLIKTMDEKLETTS